MSETIDLRPEIVNIKLYEGDAWAVEADIDEPGSTTPMDLTGATIVGWMRPENGNPDGSDDIELVITDGDLTEGQFWYGQTEATVSGKYDIQVTLLGAPRTYIRGRLSVLTPDISPE